MCARSREQRLPPRPCPQGPMPPARSSPPPCFCSLRPRAGPPDCRSSSLASTALLPSASLTASPSRGRSVLACRVLPQLALAIPAPFTACPAFPRNTWIPEQGDWASRGAAPAGDSELLSAGACRSHLQGPGLCPWPLLATEAGLHPSCGPLFSHGSMGWVQLPEERTSAPSLPCLLRATFTELTPHTKHSQVWATKMSKTQSQGHLNTPCVMH